MEKGDIGNFISVWLAADVAFQIIKVDVTPSARADINQSNACALANVSSNIPELASHRFVAFTSGLSDSLQKRERKEKEQLT